MSLGIKCSAAEAGHKDLDRIKLAWQLITASEASADEIKTAQECLKAYTLNTGNQDKAWQQCCLIMLNLNEFIYLD